MHDNRSSGSAVESINMISCLIAVGVMHIAPLITLKDFTKRYYKDIPLYDMFINKDIGC